MGYIFQLIAQYIEKQLKSMIFDIDYSKFKIVINMNKEILLLTVLIGYVYCLQVPQIQLQQTLNAYNSNFLLTNTCKQMNFRGSSISRLGSDNVIYIFSKTNYSTLKIMQNFTYPTLQNVITDHLCMPDHDLLLMEKDKKLFTWRISTLAEAYDQQGDHLQNMIYVNNLIFMTKVHANHHQLKGFQPNTGAKLTKLSISSSFNHGGKLKASYSEDRTIMVLWTPKSDVYIYKFRSNHTVISYLTGVIVNSTIENLTQSISISSNNQLMILQVDHIKPIRFYNISSSNLTLIKQLIYNGTINKVMFFEPTNKHIALFNDTAVIFYEFETLNLVKVQSLVTISSIIEIDYSINKLLVCKDHKIQIYNFSINTVNCSSNCTDCINQSHCTVCAAGFILINNACVKNIVIVCPQNCITCFNQSHCMQCSPGYVLADIACQNELLNTTNHTPNITQITIRRPDGTLQVIEMSQTQKQMVTSARQGLSYSNLILQKIMLAFSAVPFMYFFLSNLNFFSICSLYAYANISIPDELLQIMQTVQSAMSNNIFSMVGIVFDFQSLSQEKVNNQRHLELGLTSNFLQSNYYTILNLVFMLFVVYIFRFLSRFTQKNGAIYDFLNQKYSDVIFGIILSSIPQIILPFKQILWNLSFHNFSNKVNLSLQIIFLGIILIFMGFMTAFVALTKVKISKKIKKQQKPNKKDIGHKKKQTQLRKNAQFEYRGFDSLKMNRQNIYFGFNNLIFAAFVILQNPLPFLIIGQLFTIMGIKKAFSYRKWRLNRIVLSIYPIIFHACFISFRFSENSSILVWSLIICLVTYFLGSIHELLTIFAEVIKLIWKSIKRNKISDQTEETKNSKLNIEKNKHSQKKVNKKENTVFKNPFDKQIKQIGQSEQRKDKNVKLKTNTQKKPLSYLQYMESMHQRLKSTKFIPNNQKSIKIKSTKQKTNLNVIQCVNLHPDQCIKQKNPVRSNPRK